MNPEEQAWTSLRAHAARQIRPGFADRVMRAAREGARWAPSLFSQFALSAVTAALCFGVVAFIEAHVSSSDAGAQNDVSWQDIAAASADTGLGQ